eukprot:14839687-Alexandrium_andersonii.AAC.1
MYDSAVSPKRCRHVGHSLRLMRSMGSDRWLGSGSRIRGGRAFYAVARRLRGRAFGSGVSELNSCFCTL